MTLIDGHRFFGVAPAVDLAFDFFGGRRSSPSIVLRLLVPFKLFQVASHVLDLLFVLEDRVRELDASSDCSHRRLATLFSLDAAETILAFAVLAPVVLMVHAVQLLGNLHRLGLVEGLGHLPILNTLHVHHNNVTLIVPVVWSTIFPACDFNTVEIAPEVLLLEQHLVLLSVNASLGQQGLS